MLSEELILHFVSKIFKGYHIKARKKLAPIRLELSTEISGV